MAQEDGTQWAVYYHNTMLARMRAEGPRADKGPLVAFRWVPLGPLFQHEYVSPFVPAF